MISRSAKQRSSGAVFVLSCVREVPGAPTITGHVRLYRHGPGSGVRIGMDSFVPVPPKEAYTPKTPMRCPVCDQELTDVQIRDLGGVTADIVWQVHAGYCPVDGWFQAEVVSRPPREIFPVHRPFGAARRLMLNNNEIFAFATVWNDVPSDVKRSRVDPLDPQYWRVRSRKAEGAR